MPKLSFGLEGGKTTHELTDGRITIGRALDNSLQIDDPSVSSRHARLSLLGRHYQLTDLDSTNGTRVNGEIVKEITLRVGDRIRFGKVEARYEADVVGESQALPEPGEIETRPAEMSAKPADFANASPFQNRKKETDYLGRAIFAVAALASLALLLSLLNLLRLHGPESFIR